MDRARNNKDVRRAFAEGDGRRLFAARDGRARGGRNRFSSPCWAARCGRPGVRQDDHGASFGAEAPRRLAEMVLARPLAPARGYLEADLPFRSCPRSLGALGAAHRPSDRRAPIRRQMVKVIAFAIEAGGAVPIAVGGAKTLLAAAFERLIADQGRRRASEARTSWRIIPGAGSRRERRRACEWRKDHGGQRA